MLSLRKVVFGIVGLVVSSTFAMAQTEQRPAAVSKAGVSRTIAVMPMIGRDIDVVTYRGSTGTNVKTYHQRVPLTDSVFDDAAVLAAKGALEAANKGNTALMLQPSQIIYETQASLVSNQQLKLPSDLDTVLKAQNATHLLLIVKSRHDAAFQLTSRPVGDGWLEGLGYYIDHDLSLINTETKNTSTGFLGSYAYFKVVMADLSSGKVLKEVVIKKTVINIAGDKANEIHPWNALSSREKVDILVRLVQAGIQEAVKEVM
jgi:hypothetical protein